MHARLSGCVCQLLTYFEFDAVEGFKAATFTARKLKASWRNIDSLFEMILQLNGPNAWVDFASK